MLSENVEGKESKVGKERERERKRESESED